MDATLIQPGTILPGAVVRTDQYGDWAAVPEMSGELYVSSTGWTHQFDVRTNKWFAPSRNAPKPDSGDVFVAHRGKDLRVHQLMARAFFGPPPTPAHTVDHLAKYGGDHIRERSDNRVENLRWATKREQCLNRRKQKPRRDGRAIWVWRVGTDVSTAVYYDSALAAAKALGLNAGSVSEVAKYHGAPDPKRVQTSGYHVKHADMEPDKIKPDEEFRAVESFLVSQYGRARDPQTNSFSFTPRKCDGLRSPYLSRTSGPGTTECFKFHGLVAKAWPDIVLPPPDDGVDRTIDHIDRDPTNNVASNLRWATLPEQATNRTLTTTMQKSATPVEVRAPGSETWVPFRTQCEAVKVTNLQHGTKLTQQTISDSLKMAPSGRTINKGKHKGWSIRVGN
jgi:hypothetical protein